MALHVGLVCGGPSAEHEISLLSARHIYRALEQNQYQISLIYIDKKGYWYLLKHHQLLFNYQNLKELQSPANAEALAIMPGENANCFLPLSGNKTGFSIDVVFPCMHGRFVEDGGMQGLLEMMRIPYVGSRVLGSAVNMDKDLSKRLCQQAGIKTADWTCFYLDNGLPSFEQLVEKLALPFFIKPVNTGSSIGVHKIKQKSDFVSALADVKQYDDKAIAERAIVGREIEIAVLGARDNIQISPPGEIIPSQKYEYYSYECKYFDQQGARLIMPAELSEPELADLKVLAAKAFAVLACEGMARVDCFLSQGQWYLNEVNSIPGFTPISMYPRLFELAGISAKQLLASLIDIALARQSQVDAASRNIMNAS